MSIWQLCANLLIPNCLRSNLSYSPLAALELYVINTKAVIEHGCILGNNVFVGPGAIVCGDTCIGDNVLVGAGVIIRDGIEITENVTIGMGSVVVRSIVEPGVYLGNPCRKIR